MSDNFSPKKILCVSAHPDDNEFCYGGSLAKWSEQGAEIKYLVCSDGSKGARTEEQAKGVTSKRRGEQSKACSVLGVSQCDHLEFIDGELVNNREEIKKEIVKAIREFKPDTVICMDPTFLYNEEFDYVNHQDHRVVGQATLDAVYPAARDELFYPEIGPAPHKVSTLLMTHFGKGSFVVDIDSTFDKKVEAMSCHLSQVEDENSMRTYLAKIAEKSCSGSENRYAERFVRINLS